MNARDAGGDVSGYQEKRKREKASVMWSTGDLGRRKVGAGSVMGISRDDGLLSRLLHYLSSKNARNRRDLKPWQTAD